MRFKYWLNKVWMIVVIALFTSTVPGPAMGAEKFNGKVRLSDVGWTDITATTALTSVVLEALGYIPKTQMLSVPVTFTSLKNKDIDIFLGLWMPTMTADITPYKKDGSVEVIGPNLTGAKYSRELQVARNVKARCSVGKFPVPV